MADKSKIEWCDATWNPVTGCTPCSPGCERCYARTMLARHLPGMGHPGDPGTVTFHTDRLDIPLHWRKPRRIFVCSMSDLFHEDVPDEWRDRILARAAVCRRHTMMILTKREIAMLRYIAPRAALQTRAENVFEMAEIDGLTIWDARGDNPANYLSVPGGAGDVSNRMAWPHWPLPNVWLGVTVCNQAEADAKIPLLLDTPAALRFVSVEPMLGPVDVERWVLSDYDKAAHEPQLLTPRGGFTHRKLDWVICGEETGPGARKMKADWAGSLRDQCAAAGVPFFFKGWGTWGNLSKTHPDYMRIDGSEWRQFPEGGNGQN